MNLKAYWAQLNRERKATPPEELRKLAKRQVARRLTLSKSDEKKARLRVFPHPRSGIRFVLYAGRWFIRAQTWERLVFRAAFGPWTKTPPQVTKQRKAPRPPCTKPTATIRHASSDRPMQLTSVKRDGHGRVVSGYVENGGWQLSADHERQVFWSDEHPELKTCMANFNGWDR